MAIKATALMVYLGVEEKTWEGRTYFIAKFMGDDASIYEMSIRDLDEYNKIFKEQLPPLTHCNVVMDIYSSKNKPKVLLKRVDKK